MDAERPHDLVLFGATGFTGALTAEYLARHAPADCRWALAGRNRAKLEALRAHLATLNPGCAHLPLLAADAADPASLREVATAARVVVSTVGPYLHHGEPLVAACADAGTDYLDLTGEPEFVDRMYLLHHRRAVETGARLVHSCGFDSVPHDLGVLFTLERMRELGVLPDGSAVSVRGFVWAGGMPSGGTFASALTVLSRRGAAARAARQRRAADPWPADRRISAEAGPPRHSAEARAWAVPLPTIDPLVVARSAAARSDYGTAFRYGHYAAVRRLPVLLAGGAGLVLLALAAQLPPLRRTLTGLRKPGVGPSPEQRAASWFTVRFVGEAGPGRRLFTEVSGGDPGYTETAKMLAESALSLAFDDLPATAGQVTPAVAMGTVLIDRLIAAGLRFTVLDAPPTTAPGRR
ncbi:saccharopine dehydrogenase NADP-binding domain-containing protein [Kitasatospora sp. NPDC050463]|uniref:saccharopine dehydrogenase family protein n=1 Tax=Kitasatospora sp. NPDC050463 TaxID=3155786 RepID=UPI0033FC030E